MDYFCPKNTFLQVKHYKQRIYPTLLSTSYLCGNSQNDLIHFSQHSPSTFFQLKNYILLPKQPIKVTIFRLATARIKIHQIPHVIFGTKSQFFFKLCITLQCHETNSSVLFHLNLYMLWTKGSDQSVNFQTFDCLHGN